MVRTYDYGNYRGMYEYSTWPAVSRRLIGHDTSDLRNDQHRANGPLSSHVFYTMNLLNKRE